VLVAGICPVHWTDNDGSLPAGAIAEQPHGTPNYNSG
jgi:hypothetical protein